MANLKYKNANGEWKILNTVRGPKGDNADITINGETIENASIYTATESGNPGQFLMSSGDNKTPEWTSLSEVAISGNYDDLNNALESTSDLISDSEKVLTSGGAYIAFAQRGVPSGGGEGQVLIKKSDSNYEVEWGEAADPNAIGGDGSIRKIIELTYEEYKELETQGKIDAETEYHILDASSAIDELQKTLDGLQNQINTLKESIPTVNNTLTSTSTTEALSAAQGKILNEKFDAYSKGVSFTVQTVNYTIGKIAATGEQVDITVNFTPTSGYTPIGIVGYNLTGSSYTRCGINTLYLSSNSSFVYSIRQFVGDVTTASLTLTVRILLYKNNY